MKLKHLILSLLLVITASSAASAGGRVYHDASILPTAAKTAIEKNFKADISFIKVDKSFGRISEYEVVLSDGTEVTFDRAGNWTEIEASLDRGVPKAYIPQNVEQWVKKNHKGCKIVGLEKKTRGLEVTLSNGIEAKFDSQGSFIRYDE